MKGAYEPKEERKLYAIRSFKKFKKWSVQVTIILCGLFFCILILTGCSGKAEADMTESAAMGVEDNITEASEGEKEGSITEPSLEEKEAAITESVAGETEERESLDDSGIMEDLSENVKNQLTAFANAKDIWNMEDYSPWLFSYAVFDPDMDGRLELITSVTAGTGLYSENHFYQADDTGILELPQEYYSDYAEFDILNNDSIAYRDGNIIYYPSVDVEKNGIFEAFFSDGAYYVENGVICSRAYRSNYRVWHDEGDDMEETFCDIEGNEISQDVWERSFDAFYGGMEQMSYVISWKTIEAGELTQTSCQGIFAELADSYREAQFDGEALQ